MSVEIALDGAGQENRQKDSNLTAAAVKFSKLMVVGQVVVILILAAWYVRTQSPYSSSSDLAYYLGLSGGTLMLFLLVYPLRKRIRLLNIIGPLRHWFRFHMIAGVLGPLLILFHSTFQVRSLNAAVALGSMLLVVASGIVGRFIYRRIHRGLYGSRTTHEELQQILDEKLQEVRASASLPVEVKQEIERFAQLVTIVPEGRWQRISHFALLGTRRRRADKSVRKTLARYARRPSTMKHGSLADLHELLLNIDATLKAAETTAQFTTYERLFSQWHAVHIPFLYMLLITAIVHVVAVHAY